jgi:hypothetical protein
MVRRIDENGFRWLEPPYTPEEQMLLGGKPSVSESLHAETFSVSVDATYERYFLGVDATSAGAAGRKGRNMLPPS